MELVIKPAGLICCLYDEGLNLHVLGQPRISRGSYVESTTEGQWTADLAPVNGPLLGPFHARSQALSAERQWLTDHWLLPGQQRPVSPGG